MMKCTCFHTSVLYDRNKQLTYHVQWHEWIWWCDLVFLDFGLSRQEKKNLSGITFECIIRAWIVHQAIVSIGIIIKVKFACVLIRNISKWKLWCQCLLWPYSSLMSKEKQKCNYYLGGWEFQCRTFSDCQQYLLQSSLCWALKKLWPDQDCGCIVLYCIVFIKVKWLKLQKQSRPT